MTRSFLGFMGIALCLSLGIGSQASASPDKPLLQGKALVEIGAQAARPGQGVD